MEKGWGKITGVAWQCPGQGIYGTIGVVTTNNGYEKKAYLAYICETTNPQNDAMQIARTGSRIPYSIAEAWILECGKPISINYKL